MNHLTSNYLVIHGILFQLNSGNRDTPHGEPPPPGNVLARQRRPRPRPRSVFASTMESTGRGEGRVDEAKLTAEDPWCETETQRDRSK